MCRRGTGECYVPGHGNMLHAWPRSGDRAPATAADRGQWGTERAKTAGNQRAARAGRRRGREGQSRGKARQGSAAPLRRLLTRHWPPVQLLSRCTPSLSPPLAELTLSPRIPFQGPSLRSHVLAPSVRPQFGLFPPLWWLS